MKLLSGIARLLMACMLLGTTLWSCLALWFHFPGPTWLVAIVVFVFGLFGSAAALSQFRHNWWQMLVGYGAVFGAIVVWWTSIVPSSDGNWSPDVARQTTGTIDGDVLTLSDVRAFEWTSGQDGIPHWETLTYDLNTLETLDMFLSYWGGPEMAHFVLSFGFSDGRYLAWSIEVRREIGGSFTPVGDTFKQNNLVYIAALENDVIGVRTAFRGEDVQLYKLNTPPKYARRLLEEYVKDANALAKKPVWYNSITTNCTTVVLKMAEAVGARLGFDWRMIANGYLPDYAYEHKSIYTGMPLSELREIASIGPRAATSGLGPGFSQAIRVGVPSP